jgi:hypothetical protein
MCRIVLLCFSYIYIQWDAAHDTCVLLGSKRPLARADAYEVRCSCAQALRTGIYGQGGRRLVHSLLSLCHTGTGELKESSAAFIPVHEYAYYEMFGLGHQATSQC